MSGHLNNHVFMGRERRAMLGCENPPSVHARVSYSSAESQTSVRYGGTLEDFICQLSKDFGWKGLFLSVVKKVDWMCFVYSVSHLHEVFGHP